MAKKRDATAAGKLSAQLWAALGYLAGKRKNRDLIDDKPTRVDVLIEGKVGRSRVCEHVVGVLQLGKPGQRASSAACDMVHLIGLLLAELPDRDKFKKTVAEFHAKNKRLPDLPKNADDSDGFDQWIKSTEQFLALLRSHGMKAVAGAITFEVSAETTT